MNPRKWVKSRFPNLQSPTSFKVTSDPTPQYNCIAWAAGRQTEWWWPFDGKFWPEGAPRELTIDAFIAAFGTLGYSVCGSQSLEEGFEKIVIYVDAKGQPTHAARQLEDGQWTSKLGSAWDIRHHVPLGVECATYGSASVFLKRPNEGA